MHMDIDGYWTRAITLDSITVSGVPDVSGSGVTAWLVAGPVRVLELRDPNSGIGWDARRRPRHQYVATEAGYLSRDLPPETVGDVWRGEETVRPFTPCQPASYVITLLDGL